MMDCTICATVVSRRGAASARRRCLKRAPASRNRAGNEPVHRLAGASRSTGGKRWLGGGFERSRCRSGGVHVKSRSMCTKSAFRTCTAPIPQIAGVIAFVPQPTLDPCRPGAWGRCRERPAYSACLIRHGDGWDVRCHPHPRLGSLPGPSIPCGKATATRAGLVPVLLDDAEQPDGQPVGERVLRRLEAALEPPSRAGITGLGATRGGGAGGTQTRPAPNP